jgi:hypothetical protein
MRNSRHPDQPRPAPGPCGPHGRRPGWFTSLTPTWSPDCAARGMGEDQAQAFCDEVLSDASMHDLLQQVDEVHVLTSLAGSRPCCGGSRCPAGGTRSMPAGG